jgi:integrase
MTQKIRAYFTEAETERLLEIVMEERKSGNEFHVILSTLVPAMLWSGMRANDFPLLRVRDLRTFIDEAGFMQNELFLRGKSSASKKAEWVVVRKECKAAIMLRKFDLESSKEETTLDTLLFMPKGKNFARISIVFREMLRKHGLYLDAEGGARSLYSLRHCYATERLRAGTKIQVIAANMRTSVREIETTYSHVMNQTNAKHLT